ncbi:glycerol-3-phosphate dehydrogenase/oxidase [Parabacteroides sp. 52]|uniref:glycerol-3-phosphate dehydrogenase/oxidase n=1 Tax=unclassified Parabacteroides TaxID=2649774 RepID=UPI0013D46745|nr:MULTISPECIES: glycerol-3-phosphate dehydrogenase/oxidase [unclassified Parabacteroides]MDH6534874.1 glycerol-3-phosphate dehydrogenase [Parabacteroides sp. PM5-20]NDV55591.1 glycerol-3-phosphate dehydrogenase/oxidase [Parabacteroides sp. 52]
MKREQNIQTLTDHSLSWDTIIIGGGATGIGCAVDAASRGYKTVLLEQADFTKSTSSKSTKLVHGGVRYLAQGDIGLVTDALRERGFMRKNAPHLVKDQRFIIGNYKWWEKPFYTIGLIMYDMLAGKRGLGRSFPLRKQKVIQDIPQIREKELKGGVVYHDGQFDDSRLAINLLQTATEHGATVVNYVKVIDLIKNESHKITGVKLRDELNGQTFTLYGKSIINATGVFVDEIMRLDSPGKSDIVRPSQGVHLVVDNSFLGGDTALMIPKTNDGRVMFAVPWHNKVVLGTTDTPLNASTLEPKALEEEIDFILQTAGNYLKKKPQREDVLSVFAGLRPLAAPKKDSDKKKTKEISRSHKIITSASGLITITGGKWTTYREMAEEVIDKAISISNLTYRKCITRDLPVHGYKKEVDRKQFQYVYGTDFDKILDLLHEDQTWSQPLHPEYEYIAAEVIWAVREEMAMTIEDVLARRLRLLFLDTRAAIDIAPKVASLMATEMDKDASWEENQIKEFTLLAQNYLLVPYKQTNE